MPDVAMEAGSLRRRGTSDAEKSRRNPENQQQYPIWRPSEQNLPLKRAEETGYIQDAGLMLPGRQFPGRNGTPMKAQTAGTELREVLDIRQAADYLGISADTLYKYASEGFVPAFKLGNRWRFKRSRLNDWMDQQSSGGNMPARTSGRSTDERPSRAKAKPVQSVRPARRKSAAQ
jgi:excisionase family DNA binding protein